MSYILLSLTQVVVCGPAVESQDPFNLRELNDSLAKIPGWFSNIKLLETHWSTNSYFPPFLISIDLLTFNLGPKNQSLQEHTQLQNQNNNNKIPKP